MRATVTNIASGVIVSGAGSYLIRNITSSAAIYLESTAQNAPQSTATEANGFQWLTTDSPLEIVLHEAESLLGIVATGGAQQTLHILASAKP